MTACALVSTAAQRFGREQREIGVRRHAEDAFLRGERAVQLGGRVFDARDVEAQDVRGLDQPGVHFRSDQLGDVGHRRQGGLAVRGRWIVRRCFLRRCSLRWRSLRWRSLRRGRQVDCDHRVDLPADHQRLIARKAGGSLFIGNAEAAIADQSPGGACIGGQGLGHRAGPLGPRAVNALLPRAVTKLHQRLIVEPEGRHAAPLGRRDQGLGVLGGAGLRRQPSTIGAPPGHARRPRRGRRPEWRPGPLPTPPRPHRRCGRPPRAGTRPARSWPAPGRNRPPPRRLAAASRAFRRPRHGPESKPASRPCRRRSSPANPSYAEKAGPSSRPTSAWPTGRAPWQSIQASNTGPVRQMLGPLSNKNSRWLHGFLGLSVRQRLGSCPVVLARKTRIQAFAE